MVPGVDATVSEKPTTISIVVSDQKNRRPDIGSSDAYAETGQRLVTVLLSWWPIYMSSPGHLKFARVPRHLIHIQEHLQTIQEHKDQILSS